jgi:hypothetical protein
MVLGLGFRVRVGLPACWQAQTMLSHTHQHERCCLGKARQLRVERWLNSAGSCRRLPLALAHVACAMRAQQLKEYNQDNAMFPSADSNATQTAGQLTGNVHHVSCAGDHVCN